MNESREFSVETGFSGSGGGRISQGEHNGNTLYTYVQNCQQKLLRVLMETLREHLNIQV